MTANARRYAWILWLALAAVWFGTLDYRSLIRPDEGRYAEIPREMVASGDWLTPRLNGLKYFEKPPLQYWATASAYETLGEAEWTARLWPALTGFLGILLTWYAGRRLWGARAGMLAAAVQASSLLYVVLGQLITLDMGLSFFLQLAWTGFLLAQQGDARQARRWMWVGWAALALAVLSKGLVALVLTGAALVGYSLLTRDLSPWRRLAPVSGLAVFLALAAPWFVAVSLANPEFAHFFFIHEHFERFLTTAHRRYQSEWYFIPILLVGALPWTTLMLHALLRSWRRTTEAAFQPQRFLALWAIITFAFFSLSSSKLPPYILPILPALALLAGRELAGLSRRALLLHLSPLILLALAGLAVLSGGPHALEKPDHENTLSMLTGFVHWLLAALALWLLSLIAAIMLVWRERRDAGLLTLAAGSLIAGSIGLLGHEQLAFSHSARQVAAQIRPLVGAAQPFYSVMKFDHTLVFYLGRTMTQVANQGELRFGLEQEPDKWIPTVAEFERRWRADRDAFAVMAPDIFEQLREQGMPMTEIARDPRNVVVRKAQ